MAKQSNSLDSSSGGKAMIAGLNLGHVTYVPEQDTWLTNHYTTITSLQPRGKLVPVGAKMDGSAYSTGSWVGLRKEKMAQWRV